MKAAYALLLAVSVAFPLAFSFSARFGFGPRWKAAWAAVFASAAPFILWDIHFTRLGVWSFNPRYVLGPSLLGLPVEEALFFLAIPFSCLFIYQALRRAPRLAVPEPWGRWVWGVTAVFLLAVADLHTHHAYTASVFLLGSIAAAAFALAAPAYSGHLLAAVATQYIPFLIVNGLLTALPVVQYRSSGILGYRIGTIPVEDAVYSFVLLALPVALYEGLLRTRAFQGRAAAAERAGLAHPIETPA
jgi:lycopene cyclase domain-containing protein